MKGNTSTELVGPSPSSSPCHGIWCSSDATPQASSQFWLNFNSSSPIYYYNYYFSFITDSNKLPSQIYSKILKPDSINLQICQMVSQANTKNFNKLHNYILPNWQPHLSWCLIKIKSEKQTVKKKIPPKVLSLVSTPAIVLADCFCCYYSKTGKKKRQFGRIYPLKSCRGQSFPALWAYVNSALHISQKCCGGLEPGTEWELLPKHFSIRREKKWISSWAWNKNQGTNPGKWSQHTEEDLKLLEVE